MLRSVTGGTAALCGSVLRRSTVSSLWASTTAAFSSDVRSKGSGEASRVCAVLGSQWGDEGKGKLADSLAKHYDIVARFNGGNNAGHTVVVDGKKFAFHLLPCGLVYPHTMNVLGNGTVIHLDSLFEELDPLDAEGITWKDRLFLSDRAHLVFDFHKLVDGLLEDRLAASGATIIGTTRKGIGPAYASRASRTGLRVGMLRHMDSFKETLKKTVVAHQLMYDFEYDIQADIDKYEAYASTIQPMIIDSVAYVNQAYADGKNIITEGANAAMLDIDYGTYPFVTSSTTTAGGIATGLGLSPDKVDCVMGVAKAYTTRVGSGPFPTELTDSRGGGDRPDHAPESDIGLEMQNVGHEYGVTTGRKRRCGWLDAVVLQYSHMVNNFSGINLTKLDVLDGLAEVKICVGYEINGVPLAKGQMPSTLEDLAAVSCVYETLPGWQTSTETCRSFSDLPKEAQAYVTRVEELLGCPVTWIGVGAGREAMVKHF